MLRGVSDAVALFVLPFAIYALVLVAQRRFRLFGPQWAGDRLAVLSLAGLALVLLGLLALGLVAPRREGAYVPAHLDNGRLVPGEIR